MVVFALIKGRLDVLYNVRLLYASDEQHFNMNGNIFNRISLAGLRHKKANGHAAKSSTYHVVENVTGGLICHTAIRQLHACGQGAGLRVPEENGNTFPEGVEESREE